jgi:phage shock protein A
MSELLGEHAWRESGLGAPDDIDQLKQQVLSLEQHVVDLRVQLAERDQDLAAARAANRELMARINTANPNR